jgi:hypothetical protein
MAFFFFWKQQRIQDSAKVAVFDGLKHVSLNSQPAGRPCDLPTISGMKICASLCYVQ